MRKIVFMIILLILSFSGHYYSSAEIERVGNEPVLETLNELGGWPVLEQDKWNASSFNWLDSLIKFRKAGFSHDILMDLSVNTDYRNNTRHVIDVSGV